MQISQSAIKYSIAVTQPPGDNSTKVATTAYVDSAVGSVNSLAEILALSNLTGAHDIQFSGTAAVTAAAYSIGRDADTTNQMHLNVPTGHGYEFSVNDVAILAMTPTSFALTPASANAAGNAFSLAATFAPTSGAAAWNACSLAYTVNQTGGANGTVTGLLLNATETAAVGQHYLVDYQIGGVSKWSIRGGAPIASAASAVWDGYKASALTQTVTGNTAITTAAGFNKIAFYAPTITGNTATCTITNAATVYISGAPIAGANVAITNPTALVVGSGNVGIGTSSPSTLMELYSGTAAVSPQLTLKNGDQNGYGPSLLFSLYGYSGSPAAQYTPAEVYANYGGALGGSLIFYLKEQPQNSRKEVLTLKGNGSAIMPNGGLTIGASAPGATAAKTLALSNSATAPSASADLCHLYCADISAGNATLAIYTETDVATDAALTSTHSLTVFVKGSKFKIPLVSA